MNERTSQMIQNMAKQVEEQLMSVERQLQEFDIILHDLNDYTKVEEGSEIMAPITNGIFVKAKTTDTKNFIINVGGQTLVEKNLEQTKEMIDKQIDGLQKYRDELLDQLENANQKI